MINTTGFKGSTGYVSCIKINRNGVWYEVILTDIKSQHKRELRPEKLVVLESMLDPFSYQRKKGCDNMNQEEYDELRRHIKDELGTLIQNTPIT